jgi:hypothetical protein
VVKSLVLQGEFGKQGRFRGTTRSGLLKELALSHGGKGAKVLIANRGS